MCIFLQNNLNKDFGKMNASLSQSIYKKIVIKIMNVRKEKKITFYDFIHTKINTHRPQTNILLTKQECSIVFICSIDDLEKTLDI